MRRLLALALVALSALAGCSGGGETGPAPSSSPTPTGFEATASGDQIEAAEAALAAYESYIDAVVEARANPSVVPPELKKFSTAQALAGELSWLMTLVDQRVEFVGRPESNPTLREVNVEAGSVRIVDCQRNGEWIPIDSDTGESRIAPGQPDALWVDVVVRNFDGRWLVAESRSDRSREC